MGKAPESVALSANAATEERKAAERRIKSLLRDSQRAQPSRERSRRMAARNTRRNATAATAALEQLKMEAAGALVATPVTDAVAAAPGRTQQDSEKIDELAAVLAGAPPVTISQRAAAPPKATAPEAFMHSRDLVWSILCHCTNAHYRVTNVQNQRCRLAHCLSPPEFNSNVMACAKCVAVSGL
jgi:hypothetical protein